MDKTFKKRAGTSGISGQLYETKLLSLILFRLLHDDDVEEFHLASNMDGVGTFDDICFKIKLTGFERPIFVFIQAKHKEDEDTYLNYELIQNSYASFCEVRQKFCKSNDVFFKEMFHETERLFILYTNAKYFCVPRNIELEQGTPRPTPILKQARREYQSSFSNKLNDLLTTNAVYSQGFQVGYTDKDFEFVTEKIVEEEITALAEHFTKFLGDKVKQSMNILLDKYILKYHVILAESVVDISEIKSEENTTERWRNLTFRFNFFDTDDKILAMLRKKIYIEIVKTIAPLEVNTPGKESSKVKHKLASKYSADKCYSTSPINSGKSIHISQMILDEAEVIAAKNILLALKLKVPIAFGNIDLSIGGNNTKVEKRLNTLTDFIEDLCNKKSQWIDSYKIVTIDESVGEGFLSPNGGICGAIGNVLIYDKTTKLLKFTEESDVLKYNAKSLFNKLNSKIKNLHLFRFDIRALSTIPQLVFNFNDDVKSILSKVMIYEKQGSHMMVEALLKKEIEEHEKNSCPHNFPIKSDVIFTQYHNEIQKWWMSPKFAKFFAKSETNNIYQQAINNIVTEPQISAMQTTFNMINMRYFQYHFNENVTESVKSIGSDIKTIIVTYVPTLTVIKLIQSLRNNYGNKYAVLKLECMLNLSNDDFSALKTELENTDKVLLIVCDHANHIRTLHKRLEELTQATETKNVIVITNYIFVETAQEYFPQANIINDKEQSFKDLIPETQREIIKKVQASFQGQKISLDALIDDESVAFINGPVLNAIICAETISIGKLISNKSYEEIKHLYIDRKVSRASNSKKGSEQAEHIQPIKTLNDIKDDTVLITSVAGMGKSTLLTHLSLKTQEMDGKIWIVRINLLDHSQIFYKWQKEKVVIDTLETLTFMCRVILQNKNTVISLIEINNRVTLESCSGDEWATFELNMFLHFYNKRRLIFLFDGFDEICPNYKDYVINIFNIIKQFPQKQKMWVTSRPYSNLLPDLEKVLGESYEIDHIDKIEQEVYLHNIWYTKLVFQKLSDNHIRNILNLLNYTSNKKRVRNRDISKDIFSLFGCFYNFVSLHFPRTDVDISVPSKYDNLVRHDKNDNTIKPYEACCPLDNFMGTPLHLYLFADYVVNLVYINEKVEYWALNVNICTIYKMFVETKVRTVLFEDKNKADVTNPDVMRTIEKELRDCINMHKRLGAYSVLNDIFYKNVLYKYDYKKSVDEFKEMRPFSYGDSAELDAIINRIKNGTEKTGLISHVTECDVPVFTHRTFAEYFAAEYVCDIYKSDKFELGKKGLLYCLLKQTQLPQGWFTYKMRIDKDLESSYISLCSHHHFESILKGVTIVIRKQNNSSRRRCCEIL